MPEKKNPFDPDKTRLSLPEKIEVVFFDFDGVFTDNRVIVDEDGREYVICNRSDGLGISALKKSGFIPIVLSTEENPVVRKRCEKLEISCFQGIRDKKDFLTSWLEENTIDRKNIIYVGNDVNDIECLRYAGCGIVVADAHDSAKKAARFILKNKGGSGAVRELCDLLLSGDRNG